MTDKEIEAHLNRVVADTASDMADTMSYAMARAIKKTFCKHDWHFLPGTDRLRCIRCNAETGPSTPEQLAQDMLRDVATFGSAWSKGGKRIDPREVYADAPELAQGPVQVSPLEFVTMTLEKEHLVGKPLIWAQWPTPEQP
jgi:hypothetical protein